MGTLIDFRDTEPLPDLEPADPFEVAQIRFALEVQKLKREQAEEPDAS